MRVIFLSSGDKMYVGASSYDFVSSVELRLPLKTQWTLVPRLEPRRRTSPSLSVGPSRGVNVAD